MRIIAATRRFEQPILRTRLSDFIRSVITENSIPNSEIAVSYPPRKVLLLLPQLVFLDNSDYLQRDFSHAIARGISLAEIELRERDFPADKGSRLGCQKQILEDIIIQRRLSRCRRKAPCGKLQILQILGGAVKIRAVGVLLILVPELSANCRAPDILNKLVRLHFTENLLRQIGVGVTRVAFAVQHIFKCAAALRCFSQPLGFRQILAQRFFPVNHKTRENTDFWKLLLISAKYTKVFSYTLYLAKQNTLC